MQSVPVIHVVDDDQSFQKAMSRLLRAVGYLVRNYTNAGDFLLAEIAQNPGCILLDVRMPGPSGLDLQKALAGRPNHLPIIFLSGYGDVPSSVQAIKAGAMDFLMKPVPRDTLLKAIEKALERSVENSVVHQKLRNWRECYDRLTRRELEVFSRVVAGKMNKEIASELGAAERTIKAHRAQVMEKMQAGSIAELVHIADQLQRSEVGKSTPHP